MKFYLFDKTFGSHLPVSEPFAESYVAKSQLDPALYSVPELPVPGPCRKGKPSVGPAAAIQPLASSLPGCAGIDLSPAKHLHLGHEGMQDDNSQLHCQPDLLEPRCAEGSCCTCGTPIVSCAQAGANNAAAAAEPRRPPWLTALPQPIIPGMPRQHPSEPHQQGSSLRSMTLHHDGEPNRARCNYRPSVDAASGAIMLCTFPAAEAESTPGGASTGGLPLAAGCEMPGCVPPPASLLFAQVLPPPRMRAAATTFAEQPHEWNFGDNLQRARLLARYAAMAAAKEMRYDPGPGGTGAAPRKPRSAWQLLTSLLNSSRGTVKTAAAVSIVQRWQEAAAAARSCRRTSSNGGGQTDSAAEEEPFTPVAVIRSRDSRRLMRLQRSRVGIDREGQNPKGQNPVHCSGRAPARAFTDQYQPQQMQQHQQLAQLRKLRARNSAPAASMLHAGSRGGEGEGDGELAAAVMAAAVAADFLAAAERSAP